MCLPYAIFSRMLLKSLEDAINTIQLRITACAHWNQKLNPSCLVQADQHLIRTVLRVSSLIPSDRIFLISGVARAYYTYCDHVIAS